MALYQGNKLLSGVVINKDATSAFQAAQAGGYQGTEQEFNEFLANAEEMIGGKVDAEHEHDASDITSGILDVARGGTGVETLEALAELLGTGGGGGTQLQVVSYVGTGTKPHSIVFEFEPGAILVYSKDPNPEAFANFNHHGLWILGMSDFVAIDDKGSVSTYNFSVALDGNTLQFTGTSAGWQMNDSGVSYWFAAIKKGA